MILHIIVASLLTTSTTFLGVYGAATTTTLNQTAESETDVLPDSQAQASSIETTRVDYNTPADSRISANNNHPEQQLTSEPRHLESPIGHASHQQPAGYVTDNWSSYQPFIEYGDVSPHSKSITRIAYGRDAVQALQKSKESGQPENILYLQPDVHKPVDNQLPGQSEPNGNYIYVDPSKQPAPGANFVYLPPQVQNGEIFVTPPPAVPQQAPQNVLFYTQHVPQQVPHDNVVYITPQPQLFMPNYDTPNYYQPNHMYLVTHIQPVKETQTNPPPIHFRPKTKDDSKDKDQDDSDDKYYGEKDKKKNIVVEHKKNEEKKEKAEEESKKKDKDKDDEHVLVETSTAKAIIEEYEKHYVKKHVDVHTDGESGTTQNPYPGGTTPLSITRPAPLSKQPIVVADLDENILEYEDRVYSTTQSTIKTVKTSAAILQATQPTIVVTPRPLATTFLAPITAGIQLQSATSPKPNDSASVVVEVQKSVPYYLGKFEFFQNQPSASVPGKTEEIKQNVDLGASLLKYSIERLPQPEAQVSYKTIHQQPDQEQESGQYEYNIQAPYQQQIIQNPQEITKLEKIVAQPPQPEIISIPIKTVNDYIQKPQYVPIPVNPTKPVGTVLLDPFPPVTRLIPQYVPLKHHQEVQKVPMKSYAYAPGYQLHHAHKHHHPRNHHQSHHQYSAYGLHSMPHNYQINHGHHFAHHHGLLGLKKQKNVAFVYPTGGRYNDYLGMKPPKISASTLASSLSASTGAAAVTPAAPFKGSQQLQTIHEYLPATQLSQQQIQKYRNPRHSFGSSIRLEYGFMPPLIPSIEIDENGKPIEKHEEA